MAQYLGPRSQMVQLFYGLHLNLARRLLENPQSAKGPRQRKSGPVNNMVCKCSQLLHYFLITIHLHLASFYATIYFRKKIS